MMVARNEQGDTLPPAWLVGQNQAGFLPDTEVLRHTDWQEAANGYTDMVREWADQSDEDYDALIDEKDAHTDCGSDRATVDSILTDSPLVEDSEHSMSINGNDGFTYEFFLRWSAV